MLPSTEKESTQGLSPLWFVPGPVSQACRPPPLYLVGQANTGKTISTEFTCLARVPDRTVKYLLAPSPGVFWCVRGSHQSYKVFAHKNPSDYFKSPRLECFWEGMWDWP
jgi:hypothetical protein